MRKQQHTTHSSKSARSRGAKGGSGISNADKRESTVMLMVQEMEEKHRTMRGMPKSYADELAKMNDANNDNTQHSSTTTSPGRSDPRKLTRNIPLYEQSGAETNSTSTSAPASPSPTAGGLLRSREWTCEPTGSRRNTFDSQKLPTSDLRHVRSGMVYTNIENAASQSKLAFGQRQHRCLSADNTAVPIVNVTLTTTTSQQPVSPATPTQTNSTEKETETEIPTTTPADLENSTLELSVSVPPLSLPPPPPPPPSHMSFSMPIKPLIEQQEPDLSSEQNNESSLLFIPYPSARRGTIIRPPELELAEVEMYRCLDEVAMSAPATVQVSATEEDDIGEPTNSPTLGIDLGLDCTDVSMIQHQEIPIWGTHKPHTVKSRKPVTPRTRLLTGSTFLFLAKSRKEITDLNWKQRYKKLYYEQQAMLHAALNSDLERDMREGNDVALNVTTKTLQNSPLVPTIPIMAATLPKTILYLTRSGPRSLADTILLSALLMTLSEHTTAKELIRVLFFRYAHTTESIIQLRVVHIIQQWISGRWQEHFAADPVLQLKLDRWLVRRVEPHYNSLATALRNIIHVSRAALRTTDTGSSALLVSGSLVTRSRREDTIGSRIRSMIDTPAVISSIHDVNMEDIARQLCLMEFETFQAIKSEELLGTRWNSSKKHSLSPNIVGMSTSFNQISMWIASEVLRQRALKRRKAIVSLFIELGVHLYQLNNFNTLMAVISGLEMSAVHRLKSTWNKMNSTKHWAKWMEAKDSMSREQNYKNFRSQIAQRSPPCLPYLGIYLTDLTFVTDSGVALTSKTGNPMINLRKKIMAYEIITTIQKYQEVGYTQIVPDMRLQQFLQKSWSQNEKDEKVLFQQSLVIEPRETNPK
eukprot:TRINITY_DN5450_c0_g1_i1.p1 TRINITY_DN5450_c0_g1~~TRINITY_DN5450_c0_g1_i1.p1  ORF type:complete len:869 (+),score=118.69 TRINITY_DN5450_c0_g1_i1:158-2764(+)